MSYQWPLLVYYALCLIITPVYFLILICIVKIRRHIVMFRTTFYSLLIQHSIGDILAMIFYCAQKLSYVLIPNVLFKYQHFRIGAVCYDGVFWFLVVRSNGIALMTTQRYLTITQPTLPLTRFTQLLKPWKIAYIYWGPVAIFNSIFLSSLEIGFDSPERMILVMDPDIISKTTKITFFFVVASCVTCLTLYGLIVKFIRMRSQTVSKSLQREIRLALQVSLSFAAELILLIYLSFSYYSAEIEDSDLIANTRKYFPLAYGILSFIGPFTILIFNKDVSKQVRFMISGKKLVGATESSLVSTVKQTNIVTVTRI
ncbi:Serpentine receptor class gamma [Caenorhabditis elegans]|uniref:Serpentine receptor class gamma n=1 Tax=Caenorhabditis elegans TaxID=6239 RepID=Q17734_CAEEL|nr:Serpentine receptor class gamma [Caenorhabditis elegans]CCD63375.1 Serpentine receptor class gamma [Caenorhabditis elegans]|eukprot:NP_500876.2 Serpentine Receptor, class V [Caenorhabditis elegans]